MTRYSAWHVFVIVGCVASPKSFKPVVAATSHFVKFHQVAVDPLAATKGLVNLLAVEHSLAMPVPSKKSGRAKHLQSADERRASALTKCTKVELIELFVLLAEDECAIMSWLELELGVEKPSEEVVAETRQAIANATDFDDRDRNRSFDYDYESYLAVERNFKTLIDSGQIAMSMTLAEELMKQGSYQVEMSDEGMMTQDIEQCLNVVIKALKKKGTCPPSEVVEWCATMTEKDRVGFICDGDLQTLRERFEV